VNGDGRRHPRFLGDHGDAVGHDVAGRLSPASVTLMPAACPERRRPARTSRSCDCCGERAAAAAATWSSVTASSRLPIEDTGSSSRWFRNTRAGERCS
jgi:hypothetical protein